MTKLDDEITNINPQAGDQTDSALSFEEYLIKIHDDFVEFSEMSAFINHALASSLAEHDWLNDEIISGARRCSNWLQLKNSALRQEIGQLHDRYGTERLRIVKSIDKYRGIDF